MTWTATPPRSGGVSLMLKQHTTRQTTASRMLLLLRNHMKIFTLGHDSPEASHVLRWTSSFVTEVLQIGNTILFFPLYRSSSSASAMGDDGEKVQLYVYDLSNGLARQLSPMLLNKQVCLLVLNAGSRGLGTCI